MLREDEMFKDRVDKAGLRVPPLNPNLALFGESGNFKCVLDSSIERRGSIFSTLKLEDDETKTSGGD